MKSRYQSLSFLATLALTIICGTTISRAGTSNKSGNPYGNGSFFPNTGTFSGVLRGVNLVGVTQFSTGTNSTLSGGPLYVYFGSTGSYDDTLGVYATMNPSANQLNAFISPATNTALSTTTTNISGGGGYFNASLTTQPPNQVYSGNGVLSEIIDITTDPVTITNASFSISGCRISNE